MFSLALGNILFYKGRSLTTVVLTFVSAMFFVIYVSMTDGSHKSMLENSLKIYTGAIEIYHKDYRDIGGNEYLIGDVKTLTDKLSHIKGIEAWSSRYETYGLLCSGEYSAASLVGGIEPAKEKELSSLFTALKEGSYLSEDSKNCLYMGAELVKKLKLRLGDEISFIGAACDNSFAADIFKLCGIFKTGSFISRNYFDTLMLSQNKATSIVIKLKNIEDADSVNAEILKTLHDETLESVTWKTLMKTLVEAIEVDNIFGYISLSLFFVVIFFVIMIYGFVNVSSRIKEFGVLRCIGLSNAKIFWLLFDEIFLLSTFALVFAAPLSGIICYYYELHPIVIDKNKRSDSGDISFYAQNYRIEKDLKQRIPHAKEIQAEITKMAGVRAVVSRLRAEGLASTMTDCGCRAIIRERIFLLL